MATDDLHPFEVPADGNRDFARGSQPDLASLGGTAAESGPGPEGSDQVSLAAHPERAILARPVREHPREGRLDETRIETGRIREA